MPNKIIEKFRNIYIANVENNQEFLLYTQLFQNTDLIMNNLLFNPSFITKSSYSFDLFVFLDVYDWVDDTFLTEISQHIMDKKGEMWFLCNDEDSTNNTSKVTKLTNILENTRLRNSTIKFTEEFSLVLIRH
jgi:hypothetical protein